MLFEFDSDQRLWQDTVREAVARECPPALVRSVAEDDADPAALWKFYVGLGWTELTDPADAVELAIVLEELGRATDPTPYLATMTQFAPLAPGVADPGQTGAAVFGGVTAHRDGAGWLLDGTARHVLDGDRAEHARLRSRPAYRRGGLQPGAGRRAGPDRGRPGTGPAYRPHRHGPDDGGRLPAHPRPDPRPCPH